MSKEQFEWIHSWCDETGKNDLPRVLLIGDSITYGYQEKVRGLLKGICYVDYISTSYAIDLPIYSLLIKSFVKDSKYDFIHFNHGLHGEHMSTRTYRSKMKAMIKFLMTQSKVALVESTLVRGEDNIGYSPVWKDLVRKRNKVVNSLAIEFNLPVDELFAVSKAMPLKYRFKDGIHYISEGYDVFASQVANFIKKEVE